MTGRVEQSSLILHVSQSLVLSCLQRKTQVQFLQFLMNTLDSVGPMNKVQSSQSSIVTLAQWSNTSIVHLQEQIAKKRKSVAYT